MPDSLSDSDVLDRIFEKLLNHNGSLTLKFLLSIISPNSGTAQVKYYKSVLDTSSLIEKKPAYGDEEFQYTLSQIGILKMTEYGSFSQIKLEIPKSPSFRMSRNSKYPDDPGTDIDRLDIIFMALNDQPLAKWNTVSTLLYTVLRWSRIPENELNELEKLIIDSDMVESKHESGQYRYHIKLSQSGRQIIRDHGSYSKYIEPKKNHKEFIRACDILSKWIAREKKIGITYPLDEIKEFWNSTGVQYELQPVIDSLDNNGLLQSYVGPFYGPSKRLLEALNFPEPILKGMNFQKPVQTYVHIQNIEGNNNVVTGQNSGTTIEGSKESKSSFKDIRNGVIYTVIAFFVIAVITYLWNRFK